MLRRLLIIPALLLAAACGSSPTAPAEATIPAASLDTEAPPAASGGGMVGSG